MHSACTQHALGMQSSCNHHALGRHSAGTRQALGRHSAGTRHPTQPSIEHAPAAASPQSHAQ
jgi:hypothetical protein